MKKFILVIFVMLFAGVLIGCQVKEQIVIVTTAPEPPVIPSPTATIAPIPTLGIGSTMTSDKDGMTLVYVPAGEFEMGGSEQRHTEYLDAFWIDMTEVTNAQYRLCVEVGVCVERKGHATYPTSRLGNAGKYYDDSNYKDYPVVYVTWNDANDYCGWAGRRLPTDTEWEKVARGSDGRTYPWGEGIDCSKANYWGCKKFSTTSPVGYYDQGASPYGALDMAGNVDEWVSDEIKLPPSNNPQVPSLELWHLRRGGAWSYYEQGMSSYRRTLENVYSPYSDMTGFRCALSQPF